MKKQLRYASILVIFLCLWHSVSCVSVSLPSSESTKASGVQHAKLSSDFQQFFPEHVDAAWKNNKNGNSISYYSECDSKESASFKNIQKGLIRSVQSAKVEREMNIRLAGETGLRSIVSGNVDSKTSLVDLIIFSKEKCIFILTYVGRKESFLENQKEFEKFYTSFEVDP